MIGDDVRMAKLFEQLDFSQYSQQIVVRMTNCNLLDGKVSYSRLRYLNSRTEVGPYLNHCRLGHAESPVLVG